ncbi:MAG: hypothetical protein E5V74_10475 [Mesorhizobium sp.]|nr:MAG: hypothetical protein E5V74_10475 [Mesorhizobium sp.]
MVALLLPLLQTLQNQPGHSSKDAEIPNLSAGLADFERMSGRRSNSVPKKDAASGNACASKSAQRKRHASKNKHAAVARKS